MRRNTHLARAVVGPVLVLLSALAFTACTEDAPTNPGGDDQHSGKPDTSTLEIVNLGHTAYNADGHVQTGLTLQWRLHFESTTGRDCRIRSYTLRNQQGEIVFSRLEPNPGYVSDGEELTDKVIWIPIEGSSSAGLYVFSVAYETGQIYHDADDHGRWVGPASDGTVTETFEALPINIPL